MIKLTRLDGESFVLNADLIRYIEQRPDTFITLISGERIVVGESMKVVIERAVQYQQQKHFMPMPTANFANATVSTPATN
ncbi:MAG: flagellar FlbD family protein [Rubripirellula sp.]|jgi:flagellar protein FlbD|nr:flagellar FlbD family protein [Rubripirellula sp.]|tara:strand:+ start:733 stop:972 length:240 start_codon:yes stop_codon:yes gene_type:complete